MEGRKGSKTSKSVSFEECGSDLHVLYANTGIKTVHYNAA